MNYTNSTLQLGALLAAVAFGGVGAAAPLPQQNVFVSGEGGSHVIYSDDRGLTWMIGGAVRPQMNECQAVELSDGEGSLLLNMRNTPKAKCRA
jgi:hypothetical protein